MKWLEILEIRSTVLDKTILEKQLTNMLNEIKKDPKETNIKLFSSDTISTDFSIQIEHSSGAPIAKSKLGLHIYMALKNIGFINHKIWVKINNDRLTT